MSNVTQWDPFIDLRETMDQLFDRGFSRPWRLLQGPDHEAGMPVEIWQTDEAVEVKASLPGMRPEDVDITVANDVLTIRAEHHDEEETGQRTYHTREIAYGSYSRSFSLPVSVDSDKAQATYEHGVLHLTLPKAESVKPKQIKIGMSTDNGNLLN